ncbi:lipoyl synthase [Candidatus Woesearchaeota archaeon]|nr:lipoyl synthase [Candidatus Woesearchaeota archaeon]
MKSSRHPEWITSDIPGGKEYIRVRNALKGLNTVCDHAFCPNIADCFGRGTATFLILGNICTRNCLYCKVGKGKPMPFDGDEPIKIFDAVKAIGLKYVVITSVTRDDLSDGGASEFVKIIDLIKPIAKIEVLIPDYTNDNLQMVLNAEPHVLGHNIEACRSVFSKVRPMANYERSLSILRESKEFAKEACNTKIKSGLMIGMGETMDDIEKTLNDLHSVGTQALTVGQYLQPSKKHLPISKYYSPEEFDQIKNIALEIGFEYVWSGPLVRSSYHADEISK